MKKFFKEFKEFISKGSILDLAIGVIIGGAFSNIVNSLVKDIIMPLISLLTGGVAIEDWKWVITPADEAFGHCGKRFALWKFYSNDNQFPYYFF